MSTTLRLFLAMFPPPAAQAVAHAAIERLRAPGDGVSWVRSENLHYTLRFLGDQDEAAAVRAEAAAHDAASALAPFAARLGSPGAFPSASRARVLWLGLRDGAEPFMRLAKALDDALARNGFESNARAFTPHLTLGRVRTPGGDWTARLAGGSAVADDPDASFEVRAIDLVESRLGPGGSRYLLRASAGLVG